LHRLSPKALTYNMERSLPCLQCGRTQNVHRYPCEKVFCSGCIVEYHYAKLKVFKTRLENQLESFKNEASFLACLQDCGLCRVSMSIETLQGFLQYSTLSAEDKEEFRRLSTIGRSYFSGIQTNFFKCLRCEGFWYYKKNIPFLCTKCICDLLRDQTSFEAKVINFLWTNSLEEVMMSDWMGKDFYLLRYDQINDTYYHDQILDNEGYACHQIKKLKDVGRNESFLIVRALAMDISEDFLVVDNHVQDIRLICLASALPKLNY
jgi:hypothetical protein